MKSCDVLIIGAGAAGMMCAIEAGKRGRNVLLVDHSEKIGRKILISGGGRCNFTNIYSGPESFVSQNPQFCKSALARYKPSDFIELVNKHGIKFHEKKLGQLFCDKSAQDIVRLLVEECNYANNSIELGCTVESINRDKHFTVKTNKQIYECESLVIATGGLSIPQIGATGLGYDLAKQFGLSIVETAPSLDGFNFNRNDLIRFESLAGVSIDSVVSCAGPKFRENILFTHNGLSGPASLQASLYWKQNKPIEIDLLPDINSLEFLKQMRQEKPKTQVKNILAEVLPKRFADEFCQYNKLTGNLSELSDKRLSEFAQVLKCWSDLS